MYLPLDRFENYLLGKTAEEGCFAKVKNKEAEAPRSQTQRLRWQKAIGKLVSSNKNTNLDNGNAYETGAETKTDEC